MENKKSNVIKRIEQRKNKENKRREDELQYLGFQNENLRRFYLTFKQN